MSRIKTVEANRLLSLAVLFPELLGATFSVDQTLFTRWDAVERAWQLVTPILDVWTGSKDFSFPNYAAGSQGPPSADKLFPGWRRV